MSADTDVEVLRRQGRIVVGASPAGLRAAETLREQGFTGSLTMIGDEPYEPYDRPPLSKQVLLGRARPEDTALPRRRDIHAEWRLGVAAESLDPDAKQVRLTNGDTVPYDRLLITTGTRARPWIHPEEATPDGVFVLRTRDDSARLYRKLTGGAPRVLVIGAGFTGSEVASACREQGLEVTVAERGPAPLMGALGGVIGAVADRLQRKHGVDLRCGVSVKSVGVPSLGDQLVVAQGTLAEERFVAVYGYRGRVIAAASFDGAKWLGFYEQQIASGVPFPPEYGSVDRRGEMLQPIDSAFPDPHLLTHGPTITLTGHSPNGRRVTFVPSHA
ncbi:FAD-dependent oxidoreductase [Streptomyces sp. NBC_01571]|uniref:FAD-dependent oxidoreductase n=1 Tax=Streptomyces sp. NBC_01571 TaxID=2975883 RepID=UPI002259562C|nr:FAD-dependent oxidoreductase [Streptomyces sp. NBC_01571]MCX4574730.1 FAD-dependent oxidoreductase [Streptomyces sp. NBC_01571]